MGKDVKCIEVELNESGDPTVCVTKKLEDFEILKIDTIRCHDCPSFYEGLDEYISEHRKEWDLKANESVGFYKDKEPAGYNIHGPTFKYVTLYRIRDKLD